MKTLLTILFLSLLSSPSWSEIYSDLLKRDGLYYKKFSDVPFSGEVSGRNMEQDIYDYIGSMRNGKKEGAWVRYDLLGQLSYKGNYKNDKRQGEWFFYSSDGRLIKIWSGIYRNGVKISD